jgi:hypothetical protein
MVCALYCGAIRHRVHMHGFSYHFRNIESKDIGIEHYHKACIKVLAELMIWVFGESPRMANRWFKADRIVQ